MKILPRSIIALALMVGAALLIVLPARALEVPSAPTLERPIVDKTSTLSEQQIDQLAQQITHGRGRNHTKSECSLYRRLAKMNTSKGIH